jgi:hypothetical protein
MVRLIETICASLPRFQLYEKLDPDPVLQVALLDIFTDVVEFAVCALDFYRRNAFSQYSRFFI